MRKILIADDEKIERNGIKSLLRRENFEMEILEACNGKEALKQVREQKPDLLFSDIKMPFMTGLELAEKVRDINKNTAIILFSGYSDFEFARGALRSGVTDYVLKPIDPAEFRKALYRALEQVEEQEYNTMIQQKNQDFLGEYFLQKFIHTGREEVMAEASEIVDIAWWAGIRRMLLLETTSDFFEECKDDFPGLLADELKVPFHYLNLEAGRSLILLDEKVRVDFRVLARHIHEYMMTNFRTKCYVAVSSEFAQGVQMPEGFRETELLMENRFYRQDLWVFLPDMNTEGKNHYEIMVQLLEKLEEDIRLKDITHLWEHFRKFSEHRNDVGQFSHTYVKFSCSNLIKDLYKGMRFPQEKCNNTIEQLYQCNTMQEILDILEDNIRMYEENVFANQSSARGDVEKVKSYIYGHYAEELSVEILSGGVFLSPGYMSYIFKKETGEGLSHFIRVYRLEKAKELLQNTNMKIVQICKAVGFTNSSYFCKSFREYYGCSPERFRKGEGGNEENS